MGRKTMKRKIQNGKTPEKDWPEGPRRSLAGLRSNGPG